MTQQIPPTVTGSRRADWILLSFILLLMVGAVPRILVYYHPIPAFVSVVAITAEGERISLNTPKPLRGARSGIYGAEREVRKFAGSKAARRLVPTGGRLEWSLRHQMRPDGNVRSRVILISSAP